MVDIDTIILGRKDYHLEAPIVMKEAHNKALELQRQCRERDKGKVRVLHPKLPNTWLLVSPEKAKMINANNNGRMDKAT